MARERSRLFVFGGLVAIFFACADPKTDNFREDVAMCEEAASYLTDCCPSFIAMPDLCTYGVVGGGGCGASTTTTTPGLSLDESSCILATRCADIVTSGICGRASTAGPYVSYDPGDNPDQSGPSQSHQRVCP